MPHENAADNCPSLHHTIDGDNFNWWVVDVKINFTSILSLLETGIAGGIQHTHTQRAQCGQQLVGY